MQLESLPTTQLRPEIVRQIGTIADQLDLTIKEIRATVFALNDA